MIYLLILKMFTLWPYLNIFRGPIWININYLACRALSFYAGQEGPHQGRSLSLYQELRRNVINTVLSNFQRTGYFWEQYDDITGEGIRGHPFTGWTSLVASLMAEAY